MAIQTTPEAEGSRESSAQRRPAGPARTGTRGGAVVLGALMIIAGISCMVVPKMTGVMAMLYLGALLALSGLAEVFSGTRHAVGQHRSLLFGGGLFSFTVGVLLLARPAAGLGAATLLLAGFFFASGLSAVFTALTDKYAGWRWDCSLGVVAIVLGVITLAAWPTLAVWMLGTLIGIDIVTRGATMVATALGPRGLARAPTGRAA